MNEAPDSEHQSTSSKRSKASGQQQPTTGAHGDNDEDDFETFEQHGLERGDAGDPLPASAPSGLRRAEPRALSRKGSLFIM